jgi:hypothetical protein
VFVPRVIIWLTYSVLGCAGAFWGFCFGFGGMDGDDTMGHGLSVLFRMLVLLSYVAINLMFLLLRPWSGGCENIRLASFPASII